MYEFLYIKALRAAKTIKIKYFRKSLERFKWIGWDFAIDRSGDPVMIEFNTSPGDDIQRVCGSPLFGDKTDRILDDYFIYRVMENDQLKGLWSGSEKIRKY